MEVDGDERDDCPSKTQKSVKVNLQKSLQLLDEAVGVSPGPLLRTSRKSVLKNASYMPIPVSSQSQFDVSHALMTPSQAADQTIAFARSRLGETPGNMTSFSADTSLPTGNLSRSRFDQSLYAEVTTTNIDLLLEEDPGVSGSVGLFPDFLDRLQSHPSEFEVFELLNEYSELCHDQMTLLKKLVSRVTPGQNKFTKTASVLNLVELERNTWNLLSSLYKDRLETELKESQEEVPMMIDSLGKRLSEKDIVTKVYERDDVVRQGQIVIDWLEKIAAEKLESFAQKVEFFQDQSVAWENTLHALQNKPSYGRAMVTEMDPDAPIRQNRPLADLDQEDEVRLLKYLFAHIRAGQLEEAQRVCTQCGQSWRAATLEGWKLHHDDNYNKLGPGGEVQAVEGNSYRDIWRSVCWSMANEEKHHPYEQAMYAAFSGNLAKLLPVCETWHDLVWAYYKVMVDTRVEQEIRVSYQGSRSLEQLPAEYWEKIRTPESVFKEIQATPSHLVRSESHYQYHTIQKYVILGDIDSLIEEMYQWSQDHSNPPSGHLIRFMAHYILFLRTVGLTTKEKLCVAILEAYVAVLITDNQKDLVAAYTATLPQNLQVEWYARFLEGIEDKAERQRSLELAEASNLDVPQITKLVVEKIRASGLVDFGLDKQDALDTATSPEDRRKVAAIEWLIFDPMQRAEALRQANAVMRTFLGSKKLDAAREVFDKVPSDSIDVIYRIWKSQTGTIQLCSEDENAIREFLCVQAYLDANDSFNDWFEHFHHSKPTAPDLQRGATFTEKVAFEHKQKQYEVELERWKHTLQLQTKTCKERLYNVLLFVDGGWMVDPREELEEDESRHHQMSLLRQLCLPAVCFLLHSVLHSTEQYKDCLQLADYVVSERYKLYKVFRKDELQKLLQVLRDSSIQLLENGLDPLGYEMK